MKPLGMFARFSIVGTIGFLVDLATLYALSAALGWYAARLISFLCAATATWALNRRHTFADLTSNRNPPAILREYLTYVASMLGGGLVNYLAYWLTLQWQSASYAPALGVALGSLAGLAVNFLLARYVVFGRSRR